MNIRDYLNAREDAIIGQGVSEREIESAEKELGVVFADDYREYLMRVGLAMVGGHEFTGIGKTERTNVVAATKQMKEFYKDIPDDWYAIENTNIDAVVIWQDGKGTIYYNKQKAFSSLMEFMENIGSDD